VNVWTESKIAFDISSTQTNNGFVEFILIFVSKDVYLDLVQLNLQCCGCSKAKNGTSSDFFGSCSVILLNWIFVLEGHNPLMSRVLSEISAAVKGPRGC
jgi:hypothetical protein